MKRLFAIILSLVLCSGAFCETIDVQKDLRETIKKQYALGSSLSTNAWITTGIGAAFVAYGGITLIKDSKINSVFTALIILMADSVTQGSVAIMVGGGMIASGALLGAVGEAIKSDAIERSFDLTGRSVENDPTPQPIP